MTALQKVSTAPAPRFQSVPDTARILGMSEVTLYRAIRDGQFPAIKVRGRYVVPARALEHLESIALTSGSVVDASDYILSQRSA